MIEKQMKALQDRLASLGFELSGVYAAGPNRNVVLAHRVQTGGEVPACPWVTWRFNEGDGDVYLGHYERDELTALGDFLQRAADLHGLCAASPDPIKVQYPGQPRATE